LPNEKDIKETILSDPVSVADAQNKRILNSISPLHLEHLFDLILYIMYFLLCIVRFNRIYRTKPGTSDNGFLTWLQYGFQVKKKISLCPNHFA